MTTTPNLNGDYTDPFAGLCAACTENPYENPVKAVCFGLHDICGCCNEPSNGCGNCCDQADEKTCLPIGHPTPCGVCGDESAALWGTSYCYGCGTHVCPACVARCPSLPERHALEAHPKAP